MFVFIMRGVGSRQARASDICCVCVCVCVCIYVSVDSMRRRRRVVRQGCGYLKFFGGREKGRQTYIQFVHS